MSKQEIKVPEKVSVFEDKKSGVNTVAFPIVFPDFTQGALMVTHLKKGAWNPGADIKSITIEFYD